MTLNRDCGKDANAYATCVSICSMLLIQAGCLFSINKARMTVDESSCPNMLQLNSPHYCDSSTQVSLPLRLFQKDHLAGDDHLSLH